MSARAISLSLPIVSLALVVGVSLDAGRLRARRDAAQVREVGRVLPAPDLALSPGARHLRHPTAEEPWAAFADGPATRDSEPSGGMLAAPAAAYVEHAGRSAR